MQTIILNHPIITWGDSADPFVVIIHKLVSEQYL